jgi:hypothetical protein
MYFAFMAIAECQLTSAAFCFMLWPLVGNHEHPLRNNVNASVNLSACVSTSPRRFHDSHNRMSLNSHYRSFKSSFHNYGSKNGFLHSPRISWS